MKYSLYVMGLFLVFFAAQRALGDVDSCYVCQSTKGWDDCNKNMKKTSCTGKCGSKTCDTCGKVEGANLYAKGCTLEKICEATPDSCALSKTECKSWCCSGDDCNGVSGTMASMGVVIFMGLMTVMKIAYY